MNVTKSARFNQIKIDILQIGDWVIKLKTSHFATTIQSKQCDCNNGIMEKYPYMDTRNANKSNQFSINVATQYWVILFFLKWIEYA